MLLAYYTKTKIVDTQNYKIHLQNLPLKYFTKLDQYTKHFNNELVQVYIYKNYNDIKITLTCSGKGTSGGVDLFDIYVVCSDMNSGDIIYEDGWDKFNGIDSNDFDVNEFIKYINKICEHRK